MQFDTRSLWIYLHFSQLQLDTIEQSYSKSVDQQAQVKEPLAVYHAQSNQLVQINHAAQSRGIKRGMGLASASLLYSNLKLFEYKESLEKTHLTQLANALYLITSDIVIMEPSGLVLRAQNMLHLYGGLKPYWHSVSQVLAKHGFHYQSACAFSIQAAKLMARLGVGIISDERSAINTQLKACALHASDILPKDIEKLKRIGVMQVAELDRIPLSELANRISRYSLDIISELRGQAPSKVSFFQPKSHYRDYIELLYEITNTDKLQPVLKHTLEKFSQFLYLRNAQCLHIDIQLFQREHEPMLLGVDSAMPIYRSQDWLEIITLKLDKVQLLSPIYAIALSCDEYENVALSNEDFFARKSTHIAAMSLLSRLGGKLGSDKIRGLRFVQDFRPECSSQLCDYTAIASNGEPNATKSAENSIFADRPGLLLAEPSLLTQKVKVIKGPERVLSGWWEDKNVSRDYYIGQSDQGQQLWLFKTPEQQWYLHGYFI
uniref:Y-family DNA polymerase n=1 Tax=Ningiella ruwaisensis TaxID=2364274 RepID=UPI00109FC2C6|nr:DNA polymerase Y family protein [Ningiella ruwaisensis]